MFSSALERFSFECRKVIGFALSTRCDWLKRFAPPFHPIRSKTKANCDALACIFPRFASATCNYFEFYWFNVLSVSYVIGQSNYFGFGFTTLKRKLLYEGKADLYQALDDSNILLDSGVSSVDALRRKNSRAIAEAVT